MRDDVSVGQMPPRLDFLLLRRLGELPETARRELGPLIPILNDFTPFQFKGPTDSLTTGDLDQFLGCLHLFRGQQRPPLERGTMTAGILAPRMTGPFRDDVARLGLSLVERHDGVWEIVGGLFPLWVLEADRLALSAETVLALFSHAFLEHPRRIIERWQATDHAGILEFVIQQIQQFRNLGETFAMQHKDTQYMEATWEDVEDLVLSLTTREKILQVLSPEERLRGLPPEQRLEGLSREELEQLERALKERLASDQQGNGNS